MGSKNLKAIAVTGNKKVAVAKPERLWELVTYIREMERELPADQQNLDARRKREMCFV
jgi:aldehyde:ferredoxin oxidoreductase